MGRASSSKRGSALCGFTSRGPAKTVAKKLYDGLKGEEAENCDLDTQKETLMLLPSFTARLLPSFNNLQKNTPPPGRERSELLLVVVFHLLKKHVALPG